MRQFWIIVIHYAAQLQNHLSAKKLGEENPKIRKALFKKFSNDFGMHFMSCIKPERAF